MAKIKIITDSGSDLTMEEAKQYNIDILPYFLHIDGKEYRTGIDISSQEVYEVLRTCKELPTTSQVPMEEMVNAFRKYTSEGYEVLMITISSRATGAYNSAQIAKNMVLEENPNAVIELLDTQRFAYIIAYAAIHAAKLAEEGADMESVKKEVLELMDCYDVYAAAQSLKYLEKGGRINKASLVMGNVLDIRPVLSIRNGLMEATGTIRGSKKIVSKLVKRLAESGYDQTDKTLIVVNADMPEEAEELKSLLEEKFAPKEVLIREVGPTIATHIGPVIAVFFTIK